MIRNNKRIYVTKNSNEYILFMPDTKLFRYVDDVYSNPDEIFKYVKTIVDTQFHKNMDCDGLDIRILDFIEKLVNSNNRIKEIIEMNDLPGKVLRAIDKIIFEEIN